jgi:hypothetical protein
VSAQLYVATLRECFLIPSVTVHLPRNAHLIYSIHGPQVRSNSVMHRQYTDTNVDFLPPTECQRVSLSRKIGTCHGDKRLHPVGSSFRADSRPLKVTFIGLDIHFPPTNAICMLHSLVAHKRFSYTVKHHREPNLILQCSEYQKILVLSNTSYCHRVPILDEMFPKKG